MLAVARDSERFAYILPASTECAPRTGRADHVAGQTDEDVLGQFRCGTTVALPAVIDVEIEVIDPGYTDAEIMSESAGTTTPDQDQTDLSVDPGFTLGPLGLSGPPNSGPMTLERANEAVVEMRSRG